LPLLSCGFVQPSKPLYLIALMITLFLLNDGKSAVSWSSFDNLACNSALMPSASSFCLASLYRACMSSLSLCGIPWYVWAVGLVMLITSSVVYRVISFPLLFLVLSFYPFHDFITFTAHSMTYLFVRHAFFSNIVDRADVYFQPFSYFFCSI